LHQSPRPRFEDFSGSGETLVFAHANGLPPGCYRRLLTALAEDYRVFGALHRPLWSDERPPRAAGWRRFGDDLLETIDAISPKAPVVGVGHSLGGIATALAAARRPERFRALVLIDPVLITPLRIALYNRATWLLPPKRALLRATRRRREVWPDRAAAFANLRDKRLFREVDDAGLSDCVAAMVADAREGVRLRFPREWEAAIFARAPRAWGALAKLADVPTLAIRASRSTLVNAAVWARWRRTSPGARFETVPGTHLVPIERPAEIAALVRGFLGGLGDRVRTPAVD
jgi:pimeloyl-ACP methyl ester carboxylesterase